MEVSITEDTGHENKADSTVVVKTQSMEASISEDTGHETSAPLG